MNAPLPAVSAPLRIAVLKTLTDAAAGALTADKAALLAEMQADDVEKVSARLPDGTRVASLPVCGGEPSPRVTDHAAFLAWVQENRPGEIEQVVRESYVKAVLAAAKKAARAVDPKTGDLIPGITFAPTTPYVSVNFVKDGVGGRELIARAWREGSISLPDMLALPSGDGGEAVPNPPPAPAPEPDLPADWLKDGGHLFTDEDGYFHSPEAAAAHAIHVQGGFSTPAREARRMLADALRNNNSERAAMAREWLTSRGLTLDGGDEPGAPAGES